MKGELIKPEFLDKVDESWKPMFDYLIELHERGRHSPIHQFTREWYELGPGYCCPVRAFGHWDIIHTTLNLLDLNPEHAKDQILNTLSFQLPDGSLPIILRVNNDAIDYDAGLTHPPVWVFAANDYFEMHGDIKFLSTCLESLKQQISWFENNTPCEDYLGHNPLIAMEKLRQKCITGKTC